MKWKKAVIWLLAVVTATNALTSFLPENQETVFNWKAITKAGVFTPDQYASLTLIKGELHLQPSKNTVFARLTNITWQLYNGVTDHNHELKAKMLPLPSEVGALYNDFKIVYDDGLVAGIATNGEEYQFSKNIKKAIAGVLQIDYSVFKEQFPHATSVQERSIYGNVEVDYSVVPQGNQVLIQKQYDLDQNNNIMFGGLHNISSLGTSTVRSYLVSKINDQYRLQVVNSHGFLTYHPYQAVSDVQYVMVNQTFEYVKSTPMTSQFKVQSEQFEDNLNYHYYSTAKLDGNLDLTNGRRTVPYELVTKQLKEIFGTMPRYFDKDHIHTTNPDYRNTQQINIAQRLLQIYSFAKLNELRNSLNGPDLEGFYHVLPLVGTKPSVMLIKDLIVNHHVSEGTAINMLKKFPEMVLLPSMELVKEMEDLIHLPKTQMRVRQNALLSFGILVHRASQHQVVNLDKYVAEYVSQMLNSSDYNEVLAYAYGLHNMKTKDAVKYLIPVIKKNVPGQSRLRLLSMFIVNEALANNPEQIFKVFWPILYNAEELPEARAVAYYNIMESQPTYSKLLNLEFFMTRRLYDHELFQLHYDYISSIKKSIVPEMEAFRYRLSKVFAYVRSPLQGYSFVERYEHENVKSGIGASLQTVAFYNNASSFSSFQSSIRDDLGSRKNFGLRYKIYGDSRPLFSLLSKKLPHSSNWSGLKMELIFQKHGYVTDSFYFDGSNLVQIEEYVKFLTQKQFVGDYTSIDYLINQRTLIPTDLGMPALWEKLTPLAFKSNFHVQRSEAANTFVLSLNTRFSASFGYKHGLSFYNTIGDVWQGVNRYHTVDAAMPMNLHFGLNLNEQKLIVSWGKHPTELMNIAGIRTHVKQKVFVRDDFKRNILNQSSPQSQAYVQIGNKDKSGTNHTLLEKQLLVTGHKYLLSVYGNQKSLSNISWLDPSSSIILPQKLEATSPLSYLVTYLLSFCHSAIELSQPSPFGYVIRIEPLPTVTGIDLSVDLKREKSDKIMPFKWKSQLSYIVRNGEHRLKTVEITGHLETNLDQTSNRFKLHVLDITSNEKELQVTINGVKKWQKNRVEGHLSVATSEPNEKNVKQHLVLNVTMIGQRSQDQRTGQFNYAQCDYYKPYFGEDLPRMQCLMEESTLRDYKYDVKLMPGYSSTSIKTMWENIKRFAPTYSFSAKPQDLKTNDMAVRLLYPMDRKEVVVQIKTKDTLERFVVPNDWIRGLNLGPDSLLYSTYFQMFRSMFYDECIIYPSYYIDGSTHHKGPLAKTWMMFARNSSDTGVYVKEGSAKIAFKLLESNHTLQIIPQGPKLQILLDGHILASDHGMDYLVKQHSSDSVTLIMPKIQLHLEYRPNYTMLVLPKMSKMIKNRCFGTNNH